MSTPTEKELRELDAWIAEHIMGYRWWFCVLSTEAMLERPDATWPGERFGFQLQSEKPKLCTDKTDLSLFRPTTDPAASMMVLEKCAEKAEVAVRHSSGIWYVGSIDWDGEQVHPQCSATTLPVAICLFSKKLYDT